MATKGLFVFCESAQFFDRMVLTLSKGKGEGPHQTGSPLPIVCRPTQHVAVSNEVTSNDPVKEVELIEAELTRLHNERLLRNGNGSPTALGPKLNG